jgi:hypothetical protein
MTKFNILVAAFASAVLIAATFTAVWDHDPDMHSWHGTVARDHVLFVDGYSVGSAHLEHIAILALSWWVILTVVLTLILGFSRKILIPQKDLKNAHNLFE